MPRHVAYNRSAPDWTWHALSCVFAGTHAIEVVHGRAYECMQASKFGEPLCQAFQLDLFRSGAEEWRKRMHSSEKIKAQYEKLFADSIAKEAKAKRKSKKRKGEEGSHGTPSGSNHHTHATHHTAAATSVPETTGDLHEEGSGAGAAARDVEGSPGGEADGGLQSKKKKKKRKRIDVDGATQRGPEDQTAAESQATANLAAGEHGDVAEGAGGKRRKEKEREEKGK